MSGTVLVLISSDRLTGPAVPALDQARAFARHGHRVLFACLPGRTLANRAAAAGMEIRTGLSFARRGEIWRLPSDRQRLRAVVRGETVDLILAHRTPEMLLAGLARCGVPVVRVWHDGTGRRPSTALRCLARGLGIRWAATTPAGLRALGESVETARREGRLLPGIVDVERFRPALHGHGLREDLGIRDDEVLVALPSRWKAGRGHERFLEILRGARSDAPALRGLLLGRGSAAEEACMRDAVRVRGLEEAVLLHAPAEEAYPEALAAADIGMLMTPGSDGTARAALETMALGRPLVVPAVGALTDLEGGGEPPSALIGHSDADLVRALVRLAREPGLRQTLGAAGRAQVERAHGRSALDAAVERCMAGVASVP